MPGPSDRLAKKFTLAQGDTPVQETGESGESIRRQLKNFAGSPAG